MLNKAFFGKTTCFKVQRNDKGEVYFHAGKKDEQENWTWTKIKMNDMELGEIMRVLDGTTDKWSTVHQFKDKQTQIWVNRSNDVVFFKIKNTTKAMNPGEQEVLRILLSYSIIKMNEISQL